MQSVYSQADFTTAVAGQAVSEQVPIRGMLAYHILNQTGLTISLYDDLGHLIDYIPPWFDVVNSVEVTGETLFFKVGAGAPVLQVQGFPQSAWQLLLDVYDVPQPTVRTQLAVPGPATYNIAGTVTANQGGSWSVGQIGSWTVLSQQSGTWNVGQVGSFTIQNVIGGSINISTSSPISASPGPSGRSLILSDASAFSFTLGSIVHTLPAYIWGCTGYFEFATTDGLSIAAGQTVSLIMLCYIQGVTSGLRYFFGAVELTFQLAVATPAQDLLVGKAFHTELPFPLQVSVYFPSDTQFKFGIAWVNLSSFGGIHGVSFGGGFVLITS